MESNLDAARSQTVEAFLGRIETAAGAIPDRDGANAVLIADILEAVNALRSMLGAVRAH